MYRLRMPSKTLYWPAVTGAYGRVRVGLVYASRLEAADALAADAAAYERINGPYHGACVDSAYFAILEEHQPGAFAFVAGNGDLGWAVD